MSNRKYEPGILWPVSVSNILNNNGGGISRAFPSGSRRTRPLGPLLGSVLSQVHNQLIGGQHNGHVRDLPDELGKEPPVEGEVALLLELQARRSQEGLVLGALLPQPAALYSLKNR